MGKSTNITIGVGRREVVLWGALAVCLAVIAYQSWPTNQNTDQLKQATTQKTPVEQAPIDKDTQAAIDAIGEYTEEETAMFCQAASMALARVNNVNSSMNELIETCRVSPHNCRSVVDGPSWAKFLNLACLSREPETQEMLLVADHFCDGDYKTAPNLAVEAVNELGALTARRIPKGCRVSASK